MIEYKQPVIQTCLAKCGSGPYDIEYYTPGHLYWPRIKYKSCDGLTCDSSYKLRCAPTLSYQRSQTVCVYKCDMNCCTFNGTQSVVYTEHRRCKCECGVIGECVWGYTWDPQQCKCVEEPCEQEFPFRPDHHKCLPIHTNPAKKRDH